tara:strand:+ start:12972 stop:13172 length:201 start_codon:yes stop_codon:yes gene_type:complete
MKLVTFTEEKNKGKIINLIPVHINKMRCENYFWHWSSNHGDWIRTEKIPEDLKKAYKNPLLKSNYK